jgi:hypothetical protein
LRYDAAMAAPVLEIAPNDVVHDDIVVRGIATWADFERMLETPRQATRAGRRLRSTKTT